MKNVYTLAEWGEIICIGYIVETIDGYYIVYYN